MSIEELEKLRISVRNKKIIGILVSLLIGLLLGFAFKNPVIGIMAFVGLVIIFSMINTKYENEFNHAYKEVFVKKSLNSTFKNLKYEPDSGISEEVIDNTNMIRMGDRYSANDYMEGDYKNIHVIQSDIHIEEEREYTDSDGHTQTYWVTLFRGRWMIFDFNKQFKANIEVCQKNFGSNKVNLFTGNKFKKVELEDAEFNKIFRVYAQEELDAFYVLTPQLMEKIKGLSENLKGKLLFCFIDNKLHIGLYNNQDSFEHSIFAKIDEQKDTEKISQDIKLITNFVDKLNLDNDLFKKGGK